MSHGTVAGCDTASGVTTQWPRDLLRIGCKHVMLRNLDVAQPVLHGAHPYD
jgi:hypothetical protein